VDFVDTFLGRLQRHIEAHALLSPGCSVVAAVSGGADSMAMLHALHLLNRRAGLNWRIVVGHLNHQIRGRAADLDEQLVVEQARQMGLDCRVQRRDIPAIAERSGGSVELVSRQERYAFLEELASQVGATRVALAHQADDQIETVLLNLLRGTGLRGLRGMPVKRPARGDKDIQIVRPVLCFRRRQLRRFLTALSLPWREDRTNYELTARRNVIRNQLLPAMRQVHDGFDQSVLRLADNARAVVSYLDQRVQPIVEAMTLERGQVTLDCQQVHSLEVPLQWQVLWHAAKRAKVRLGRLTFRHVERLAKLARADQATGALSLPGKVTVQKRYGQLVFRNEELIGPVETFEHPVDLPLGGEATLPGLDVTIRTSKQVLDRRSFERFLAGKSSWEELIDAEKLALPLVLRRWQRGDRFQPLGMDGEKKVGDFFTDAKVPPMDRRHVPVVCDQRGIVWLVGYRIDQRVKITSRTRKVVRLQAIREQADGLGEERSDMRDACERM